MQIRPVINAIEATLVSQATVASNDPAVEAAVTQLVAALGPALQVAAMDIAEQAAAEVRAQLPDHTVDVVLSKGFNDISENLPGQGGDNDMNVRMLYDALAAKGVTNACDKLRVRWYSRDGVTPVRDNGNYASHAKFTSIDDEVVIVGTANMDTQSWNNSREVNVVVDDPALAVAWDAQLFGADFARGVRTVQCP